MIRTRKDANTPAEGAAVRARSWWMRRPLRSISVIFMIGLTSGCKTPIGYDLGQCSRVPAIREAVGMAESGLRVVTANMWGIPVVSLHKDERFAEMARRLNADTSIDVVGMQEMWDSRARSEFLRQVQSEYPHQVDFHGEHGRSGLVILSRRPFASAPVFVPFTRTGKWWKPLTGEWMGGKGLGGVRIDADGRRPWVFTTHLHAAYEETETAANDADEYADYRRDQLIEVRRAVTQIAGEESAIVLGDFNFSRASSFLPILKDTRDGEGVFDPGWRLVEEPHSPLFRIDHIWWRPGRESTWRVAQPAAVVHAEPVRLASGGFAGISDHCPIGASLEPADAGD